MPINEKDPKEVPAAPVAPAAPVKPAEPKPAAPVVKPEEKPVAPVAPVAKKNEMEEKPGEPRSLEVIVKELEEKLLKLESKLGQANMACAKYKNEAEAKEIDAFIAEAKIIPSAKEYVRELLGVEKKEYSFKSMKEGKEEERKLSKKDVLNEVLKIYSNASGVNLVENSSVGNSESKDEQDSKIDEIKKYAAEKKISFSEAFRSLEADKGNSEDDESNEEE